MVVVVSDTIMRDTIMCVCVLCVRVCVYVRVRIYSSVFVGVFSGALRTGTFNYC